MSDSRIYADRDCVETGSGCSLKGKVIVLKESAQEAVGSAIVNPKLRRQVKIFVFTKSLFFCKLSYSYYGERMVLMSQKI